MSVITPSKTESNSTTVIVRMACATCGYIFDDLSYHVVHRVFTPDYCPKCGKIIQTVQIPNLNHVGLDNEIHFTF